MFFFPIDTLVLDCVEKELIRQGIDYHVGEKKANRGVGIDAFFR